MAKTPTPKEGCFDAVHPSTQWVEVPCGTERHSPLRVAPRPRRRLERRSCRSRRERARHRRPRARSRHRRSFARGPRSGTFPASHLGHGADRHHLHGCGVFPGVTVSSETDNGASNVFSLQLNTNASLSNSAVTALCKSTATPASCTGWVQFVYWQGAAEIWYNLLGAGSSCPSSAWQNLLGSCYLEAPKTATISGQPISNLVNMSVTGTAGARPTRSSWRRGRASCTRRRTRASSTWPRAGRTPTSTWPATSPLARRSSAPARRSRSSW